MDQERIRVGPYVFVQAMERSNKDVIPLKNKFAIPGRQIVSREAVKRWAADNGYKLTKE
jgi:hypothetical protein